MSDTIALPTWPWPLHHSSGGPNRMLGIDVFHDFDWRAVIGHGSKAFRFGKQLAQFAQESCTNGRKPALLLTQQAVVEGRFDDKHEDFSLLVVNIDQYRDRARGNAASTYFAMLHRDVVALPAAIDWRHCSPVNIAQLLGESLSVEALSAWLAIDPARRELLTQALAALVEDGPKPAVAAEDVASWASANPDALFDIMTSAGMELPDVMAHRTLWRVRRGAVDDFQRHLDANDWNEGAWQAFFEKHDWILGQGLSYHFLHSIQNQPHLGGETLDGRGEQIADFLLRTGGISRYVVLVEIKTPGMALVRERLYRNNTHEIAHELACAASQTQQECFRWDRDGSRREGNADRLESANVFSHETPGILIAGTLNGLEMRTARNRRVTFESFRRNLRNPQVFTFDEMLDRARSLIATMTEPTHAVASQVAELNLQQREVALSVPE